MIALAVFGLLMLAAAPAMAQVGDQVTAATITTTSGNCLAQNNFRKALTLDATASSVDLGYCRSATCTAAIGTTGTTTLKAGTLHYWPAGAAPRNGFCFIATSGSQPMTIAEGL